MRLNPLPARSSGLTALEAAPRRASSARRSSGPGGRLREWRREHGGRSPNCAADADVDHAATTPTGYLPLEITYTYHSWASGDAEKGRRSVTFTYEGRTDPAFAWQSGVLSTLDQRLKSIVMSAPNPASTEKVWEYDLDYDNSIGSGRGLLKSVKRCGALGGCTRAKLFDWYQTASPAFTAKTIAPVNIGGANSGTVPNSGSVGGGRPLTKVFDADGDGLDDVSVRSASVCISATRRGAIEAGSYPVSSRPHNR